MIKKLCIICGQNHIKNGKCCSKKCSDLLRKRTCLEKYGVENVMQSQKVQEKMKQTNMEKYGVFLPACSKEIQDKIKKTCLEKYGTENPFSAEEIKEKIKQINLKRYGVEYPVQSKKIQAKTDHKKRIKKYRQTSLEKYGVENPKQSHIPPEFLTQEWWDQRTNFLEAKELIGDSISESKIYLKAHQFRPDWDFSGFISQPHQRILDLLDELGIDYEINDRKQIKPYELDIWIPSKMLAIEVNGVYWHSEEKCKGESYHLMKTQMCQEKGITLLHFSDIEIEQKWEQINNLILKRL